MKAKKTSVKKMQSGGSSMKKTSIKKAQNGLNAKQPSGKSVQGNQSSHSKERLVLEERKKAYESSAKNMTSQKNKERYYKRAAEIGKEIERLESKS